MAAERDAALIRAILGSIDMPATATQFLATGATSRVWRADTSIGAVVVRLGNPAPGKATSFVADATVRRHLACHDDRVAVPLAIGRWDPVPGEGDGVEWCVDRFVAGVTAPRRAIPVQACRALGALLARLHALRVTGYGLLENRGDALVGRANDPVAGLLTRLQNPWPLGSSRLEDHPIAAAAPDLVEQLVPLADQLRAAGTGRDHCLNHTDLHEGQLLLAGERLAALLDFGDAAIGPPTWDIASFAYFHGWPLARVVLAGYTSDEAKRRWLLADARAFAILIALHHASRSITLRRPQRMESAIQAIRHTLATADRDGDNRMIGSHAIG
ncbi:MAG TPA: phosphotransferase [Chloroflexota bacterium]|nr:phosphotransferase [Chloroflexota bacterium]